MPPQTPKNTLSMPLIRPNYQRIQRIKAAQQKPSAAKGGEPSGEPLETPNKPKPSKKNNNE